MNSNNTEIHFLHNIEANIKTILQNTTTMDLCRQYSLMKYGSRKSITFFANRLFKTYNDYFLIKNKEILTTSTLITDIESSSHLIAKKLLTLINEERYTKLLPSCKYFELLSRKTEMTVSDYGKLKKVTERLKSQSVIELLTHPIMGNKFQVFVINDAFVTGAQYKTQEKLIRNAGLKAKVIYFYIIRFVKDANGIFDYGIEDYFNNFLAATEEEFCSLIIKLASEDDLIFNKRTILRLFNLSDDAFSYFIKRLPANYILEIYEKAITASLYLVNGRQFLHRLEDIRDIVKNDCV